jgi:hypothetical protein
LEAQREDVRHVRAEGTMIFFNEKNKCEGLIKKINAMLACHIVTSAKKKSTWLSGPAVHRLTNLETQMHFQVYEPMRI